MPSIYQGAGPSKGVQQGHGILCLDCELLLLIYAIEINELNNLWGSSPWVKTKLAPHIMEVPISPLCVKFNGYLTTILISPVAKKERLSLTHHWCEGVWVCVTVSLLSMEQKL